MREIVGPVSFSRFSLFFSTCIRARQMYITHTHTGGSITNRMHTTYIYTAGGGVVRSVLFFTCTTVAACVDKHIENLMET